MRTITKEFTKEQLQQIIETDHVQCGEASALARIALASLEAEVAGFIVRHKGTGNFGSWLHSKADWFKSDEYEVLRAYTAPPAPVSVPDEDLLHMAASAIDDLLSNKDRSGAGVWADIPAKLRRAAMLQGADVSLTHEGKNHHEDKLGMVNHLGDVTEKVEPVTQIEPVADLYGLTSPTGGETSFTFDAVEARDFIDGGWSCQEYVELGRYQEALTDHSEDKLAMVDHSGDSNNMVEPVTTANKLLDGWVACSERMPEDDDFVYIWPRPDFGVELHVGQYCECHPKGDGWYAQVYEQNYGIEWCSITVTHWIPLPAAPHQESKP